MAQRIGDPQAALRTAESSRWMRVGFTATPVPVSQFVAHVPAVMAFALANVAMSTWSAVSWALGIGAALAGVAWVVLGFLMRDARIAGIAVTMIALTATTDYHLRSFQLLGISGAVIAWALLAYVIVRLIMRPTRRERLTVAANLALTFTAALSVGQFWLAARQAGGPAIRPDYLSTLALDSRRGPDQLPDVYYFVLDGYGRADVIRNLFGYDNDLIPALRERGFDVAGRARANYAQTLLSLASAFNLEYLPQLLEGLDEATGSRHPLITLVQRNRLVETLRGHGYRIVTYEGEYAPARLERPDVRFRSPYLTSEFGQSLFAMTVLPSLSHGLGLPRFRLGHELRRAHHLWTFDALASSIVARDGHPTFVYAHIVAPHPPFVFRRDGSYRETEMVSDFADASHWRHQAEWAGEAGSYGVGYVESLRFVNAQLIAAIDQAVSQAERPVVIALHGDHGPGSGLDWERPTESNLEERLGILLALRVPPDLGERGGLTPSITPVNLTRRLLNTVLGTDLAPLEDRSYISTWSRPYQLEQIDAAGLRRDASR